MTTRHRLSDQEWQRIEGERLEQERLQVEQRDQERSLLRRARNGDEGARSALLGALSGRLDLEAPIVGVRRVTSDPPEFHLLLDEGGGEPTRLRLGGIDVLDTQVQFGRAFLLALGWKPARTSREVWETVATQLASCAAPEEPDEATTNEGRGRRWVDQYLSSCGYVVDLAEQELDHGREARDKEAREVAVRLRPFRDDKGVHVFLTAVQRSARQLSHGGENPTGAEVSRCLSAAGLRREATKFPKTSGAGVTTRSTWIVPND